MNNKLCLRFLCLNLVFTSLLAAATHAGEPLEVVKNGTERVIQILRDPKLLPKEKRKDRLERLKEVIDATFDYEEMAKRALGPHWRRRTPAEQEEFVKLFREFLEKIYSDKIDLYGGEKIVIGQETIDRDFAQVESRILNAKGEEFVVVYRLRRSDGWKIYDALIENISIINNYRSQFDRVINGSSYQELVKRLKAKVG